jgi:hypothetical protein
MMLIDCNRADSDLQFRHTAICRLYARALSMTRKQERKAVHLNAAIGSTGAVKGSIREVFDQIPSVKAPVGQQVMSLLQRSANYIALDQPSDVAFLLDLLREAGADGQVAVLLDRDPARYVGLDDSYGVARLLDVFREAGAHGQVAVLLDRDPARYVGLDKSYGVARLLDVFREAGAHGQVEALLQRDPARNVILDNPYGATRLLDALREAGAHQQATALTDRLPAEAMFDLFLEQSNHQTKYRFGREPDGKPAPYWSWGDLDFPT